MYYQNVNGLRTKLVELQKAVSACVYDVLVLTETNLSPDISDAELGLTGYSLFRNDRSPASSLKSSGGGVLMAAKSDLQVSKINTSINDVETLFLSIRVHSTRLLIGGTYIPPQQPIQVYEHFCEAVDEVMSSCPSLNPILLAGDFNLPQVDWGASPPIPTNGSSRHLTEMASTFDLSQINSIQNTRGVLLDLIFCSDHSIHAMSALDPLLPVEPAHPAITCEIPTRMLSSDSGRTVYDFSRCNHEAIFSSLHYLLGPVTFHIPDAIQHFDLLVSNIHSAVINNTPLKKTGCARYPCWFSPDLRRLVLEKKIAHKRYKTSLHPGDYCEFRRLRGICKEMTTTCYENYVAHVNNSIPNNIKTFWSFVKNMKKSSKAVESYFLNNESASSPTEISNLFADHFASVFTSSDSPVPEYQYNSTINIFSCVLNVESVELKLSSLDPNKGSGPDEIPPSVLKYCSALLAPHITVIFNRLLQLGTFPDVLKSSFVVPIHKSSDEANVRNYRPITIQPALGKVFESLVLDQISFACKNAITPVQHGFMSGKSVTTNLLLFEEYILSAFTRGLQVDSIYIDFSKAFDTVSHVHLLAKLEAYGVSGNLLRWFGSYLANRTLMVKFSGAVSRPFFATSGVPQGSHLGPFLFTIFLNDITECINVDCLFFADDMKVFSTVSSLNDCYMLQSCLGRIDDWCARDGMWINAEKCAVVSFHRSTTPLLHDYTLGQSLISRKCTIRDLGVTLSSDLNPAYHIDDIVSRGTRALGLLIRMARTGLSVNALKFLYIALVRSILEFASVVWSPYQIGHIQRIQRVQDRFLRVVGVNLGFNYGTEPPSRIGTLLGLDSLLTRRQLLDVSFLHKLLRSEVVCPELLRSVDIRVPSRTRSLDLFCHRSHPTNYMSCSPVPRLHRLGNIVCPHHDFFHDSSQHLKKVFLSLEILEDV